MTAKDREITDAYAVIGMAMSWGAPLPLAALLLAARWGESLALEARTLPRARVTMIAKALPFLYEPKAMLKAEAEAKAMEAAAPRPPGECQRCGATWPDGAGWRTCQHCGEAGWGRPAKGR